MARRTLTDSQIANLKVSKRKNIADPGLAGHYVRITPNGSKTFWCVARDPSGHQHWHKVGDCDHMKLDAARDQARIIIGRIKAGADTAGPESFAAVAADWVKRHLQANSVITAKNKTRYLEKHILPQWSGRDFRSIRRSDVAKLMDDVQDNAGPAAADECLSIIRSICSWYASRSDDYVSPIIKGMRRTSDKERARDRILTDDEIRALFNPKGPAGTFGSICKLLLLTGQRRSTVAAMRWDDVSIDGTWTIPNGNKRMKGTGGELVLPPMAIDIIRAQPRFAHSLYVFPSTMGEGHYTAYSYGKRTANLRIDWRLHDLRRTARSLMSRAGVRPDVAERVLGHAIGGVEGIYEHSYREEKAQALKALAGLVENILRPDAPKVVNLRG